MDHSWRQSCKVIIVGGGICGLATAIGIRSEGFDVEVLEASPVLQEIGAGIEIPPNASRILYSYGLKAALEPFVLRGAAIEMRSWKSGQVISTTPLGLPLEQRYGAPHMHIHRADLLNALAHRAAEVGVNIRLDAAVADFRFPSDPRSENDASNDVSGRTTVTLNSGEAIIADCVIGADGQRSRSRAALTGISDHLRRSGDITYRVTIPTDVLRRNPRLRSFVNPPNVNAWLGPHSHVVAYPVKKDDLFNVFLGGPDDEVNEQSPASPPTTVSAKEAKERFSDWDPRLSELLNESPALLKWTLLVQDDLQQWTHPSGLMTLVGDAAHAMLPYMGQGAAQALEDAATISTLLGRCEHVRQLPMALKTYERIRKPRATYIKDRAWKMRDVVGLPDGPLQEERDRMMAQDPFEGCPNPTVDPVLQKWLWGHDAFAVAREVPMDG